MSSKGKNYQYVAGFVVENPQLISVNDQYIHPVRKTKNGKYVSYFAPSSSLKSFKSFYQEFLKERFDDDSLLRIKDQIKNDPNKGVDLTITIYYPCKELRDSDISNYVKSLEDCIVERTGIDDSLHYRVTAEKKISSNGNYKLEISYGILDLSD